MDDWTQIIIYGLIIYFIYKANIKISELKGRRIFKRPSEWSWGTWQIYLIRNAIKPESIEIPLGMWLVIIYLGFDVVGYFVLKGIDLSGVIKTAVKTSRLHEYQGLGVVILEAITIPFIFKKKLAGFYLSIVIVSLQILFVVRAYGSPPPNIEISIAYLINCLIFPVLVFRYMIKNKGYFKANTL